MFNQFKEITIFFKNESFTEEQLQELKKLIIDTYHSKELINAAFTQIDLNVLKYKLTPIKEVKKRKRLTKNIPLNKNAEKSVVKGQFKNTKVYDITIKPHKLIKLNIEEVSTLLNIEKEIIFKITGNTPEKLTNFSNFIIPNIKVAKILLKGLNVLR